MTHPPTALIAEDEPLLASALRAELASLWPELQVLATVGDGLQAAQQALALAPAVCFFDIRMPGASGLEAAAALAEDWPDAAGSPPFPLIVFVTAYADHALAAFEAQAVDYLVKPVVRERLAACVRRLQARLRAAGPAQPADADAAAERSPADPSPTEASQTEARPDQATQAQHLEAALQPLRALLAQLAPTPAPAGASPPRLSVIQAQVGAVVHFVPVDEVIYFEAADKYVRVVTATREHLIRQSLRELLPQLDAAQFWQVHRGTVVQARCITQARREESGKVTLSLRGRPESITASRLYAHLFKGQ